MAMDYSQDIQIRPSPCLRSANAVRKNPIKTFIRLCIAENYDAERLGDNELHLTVPGLWCDHEFSLSWKPDSEVVEIYLPFTSRTPSGRTDDICRLLSLLNEHLPCGHFVFWEKDRALVYRNTLSLAGGAELRIEQAMALLASALDAAERGYPACQYVIWAGKTPEDALDIALLDLAAHG